MNILTLFLLAKTKEEVVSYVNLKRHPRLKMLSEPVELIDGTWGVKCVIDKKGKEKNEVKGIKGFLSTEFNWLRKGIEWMTGTQAMPIVFEQTTLGTNQPIVKTEVKQSKLSDLLSWKGFIFLFIIFAIVMAILKIVKLFKN